MTRRLRLELKEELQGVLYQSPLLLLHWAAIELTCNSQANSLSWQKSNLFLPVS
jgi:hypothetical protein